MWHLNVNLPPSDRKKGSRMRKLSRLQFLVGITALAALALPHSGIAAEKLKVAVLVPGLANDGSFNQVALEGAKKLADQGLITFEIREKQKDPATSEPVIRQYAQKGYDLIIGHGIELSEPILNVAKDFPKVHFAASGGPDLAGKLVVSKVGAVGGPQLPFILAAHKGFKGGLQETNPSATVVEVYTGSFDDVQKAA